LPGRDADLGAPLGSGRIGGEDPKELRGVGDIIKVQGVLAQILWRSDLFDSHCSLPTVEEIEIELTREEGAQ
jgi:hypothetical protein